MNRLIVAFLSMMVFATGVSTVNASDSATPEQVVTALIGAMDANDADRIRSLFAEHATQKYERWYAFKKSGDKFRTWLESDIIKVHGKVESPNIEADGNQVVVTGSYSNNAGYSSPANFLLVVEGGKIVSWTMRYD